MQNRRVKDYVTFKAIHASGLANCEYFEIRKKRLIKLWMVEGFVEQVKGSTAEEVADSYLVELTFRNMLQVVERNEFGRPKRCKMHDLLRELALSISIKEKFGVVHDGGEEMKECLCWKTAMLQYRLS